MIRRFDNMSTVPKLIESHIKMVQQSALHLQQLHNVIISFLDDILTITLLARFQAIYQWLLNLFKQNKAPIRYSWLSEKLMSKVLIYSIQTE